MSQRVVVLTDDEIEALCSFSAPNGKLSLLARGHARDKLKAALEHPEGIIDDMVKRGKHGFARETLSTHASMSQLDAENDLVVRSILEAALGMANEGTKA